MRARSLPWLLTLLLVQCGGTTATSEPKSPVGGGDDSSSSDADSGDGDEHADGSDASVAEKESHGPNCDDGTCSPCGAGICPSGWFCNENASGGPACSWLKECADKPSCGCVTRVLGADCKCREEAGGLKVSCS